MSKYDEDKANTITNQTILEQEFGLDTTEDRHAEIQEIRNMRNKLMQVVKERNDVDPDSLLLANIERANELLDVAQRAILNGGETNARLFEVCAQLINAVTSAAASVQNSSFGLMKHEYNMKMVEVKEKEIAVKAAIAKEKNGGKTVTGEGSVVIMSREELLRMIEREESEVHLKSAGTDDQSE